MAKDRKGGRMKLSALEDVVSEHVAKGAVRVLVASN